MWFRHRQWQRQEPASEVSVDAVLAAIQQGEVVRVLVGGLIGGRVTASSDGSTIVDLDPPEGAALSLKHVLTY